MKSIALAVVAGAITVVAPVGGTLTAGAASASCSVDKQTIEEWSADRHRVRIKCSEVRGGVAHVRSGYGSVLHIAHNHADNARGIRALNLSGPAGVRMLRCCRGRQPEAQGQDQSCRAVSPARRRGITGL